MTDTWGISSETFIRFYVTAAVVLAVLAVGYRLLHSPAGRTVPAGDALTPPEIGMLTGRGRAVAASLAILRTSRSIAADGTVIAALPSRSPTIDPFTAAVYRRLEAGGVPGGRGALARQLTGETEALRRSLVERGYLAPNGWTADLGANSVPLVILAFVGIVRIAAGAGGDKPVGYLVAAVLAITVCIALLQVPSNRTSTRKTLLRTLDSTYSFLAPHNRPSYHAYGPRLAGVSAALFAGSAAMIVDPALANAAGVVAFNVTPGTNGGSCGGGSGGGDGGGGGGGCGGGGCGG